MPKLTDEKRPVRTAWPFGAASNGDDAIEASFNGSYKTRFIQSGSGFEYIKHAHRLKLGLSSYNPSFDDILGKIPEIDDSQVRDYAKAQKVDPELEQEFDDLISKWREDVTFLSSISDISMHPCYLRIIAKGPPVIPLILKELEKAPDHLFWALTYLTGVNPISKEDAGDLDKMAKAWIKWGRENGHI